MLDYNISNVSGYVVYLTLHTLGFTHVPALVQTRSASEFVWSIEVIMFEAHTVCELWWLGSAAGNLEGVQEALGVACIRRGRETACGNASSAVYGIPFPFRSLSPRERGGFSKAGYHTDPKRNTCAHTPLRFVLLGWVMACFFWNGSCRTVCCKRQ